MNEEEIEKMIQEIKEDHIEEWVKEKKIEGIRNIQEHAVPYVLQKRTYGEGEIRLGSSIELEQSIYCYAYALCICNDDITEFMDLLTGKVHPKLEKDEDEDENAVLTFLKERL